MNFAVCSVLCFWCMCDTNVRWIQWSAWNNAFLIDKHSPFPECYRTNQKKDVTRWRQWPKVAAESLNKCAHWIHWCSACGPWKKGHSHSQNGTPHRTACLHKTSNLSLCFPKHAQLKKNTHNKILKMEAPRPHCFMRPQLRHRKIYTLAIYVCTTHWGTYWSANTCSSICDWFLTCSMQSMNLDRYLCAVYCSFYQNCFFGMAGTKETNIVLLTPEYIHLQNFRCDWYHLFTSEDTTKTFWLHWLLCRLYQFAVSIP